MVESRSVFSLSSKKQSRKTFKEDVVYEELKKCKKFEFVVFQNQKGVKHVGFLLIFDDAPKYTINFGTTTTKEPACVTVEPSDAYSDVKLLGQRVQHNIRSDKERQEARLDLDTLLTPRKDYNLRWNNCRHHVEDVMKAMKDRHPAQWEAIKPLLEQMHREDWGLYTEEEQREANFVAAMSAVAGLG